MSNNDEKRKPLVEEIDDLVSAAGGWLVVIGRMTHTFDKALSNVGKNVDCPFPDRHKTSGGKNGFRFSEKGKYEGRAICTCLQKGGISPTDLLLMDGLGGGAFVPAMREIKRALSPNSTYKPSARQAVKPVVRSAETLTESQVKWRKKKLTQIAQGLVTLDHPSAHPAREYFRKRGIPLSSMPTDVRFHPALEYYEEQDVPGQTKRKLVLIGKFAAIVSAFRGANGRVVNFHKVYITEAGEKLGGVSKVKKIDSPLPGFIGSSIAVKIVPGCRTLHVTEGVEKAWAIHLVTGESAVAAYSCGALKSLFIDRSKYDRVVIWSDHDLPRPEQGRDVGDGQYFAWELYKKLAVEGFAVGFMMPVLVIPEGKSKGLDWEDVIVRNHILHVPHNNKLAYLRPLAVKEGVFRGFSDLAEAA
ncbi:MULTISPECIES: DUF7146 domain-containing protein [Pseudomonas]|uniref:Uncharacterized protein n=1 Tax=Pseudomonas fluorescens TaxID=294 RepID=A0A161XMY6_PSEFL|nr:MULTISPECIES: toprim domain-containing protein [Pseudomonas]KZN20789.1 hypothetical protein A1D17_04400 [Pseudomonas fluorescens]